MPSQRAGGTSANIFFEDIMRTELSFIGKAVEDVVLSFLNPGGPGWKKPGGLSGRYYIQPGLLKGNNPVCVFQKEIFGLVMGVLTFKDVAEAIAIANGSIYGPGAGVWRNIYLLCTALGSDKTSDIGRETRNHYQQTKNLQNSDGIQPSLF